MSQLLASFAALSPAEAFGLGFMALPVLLIVVSASFAMILRRRR